MTCHLRQVGSRPAVGDSHATVNRHSQREDTHDDRNCPHPTWHLTVARCGELDTRQSSRHKGVSKHSDVDHVSDTTLPRNPASKPGVPPPPSRGNDPQGPRPGAAPNAGRSAAWQWWDNGSIPSPRRPTRSIIGERWPKRPDKFLTIRAGCWSATGPRRDLRAGRRRHEARRLTFF